MMRSTGLGLALWDRGLRRTGNDWDMAVVRGQWAAGDQGRGQEQDHRGCILGRADRGEVNRLRSLGLLLATLCYLLVFATSASAECAWVLWSRIEMKERQVLLSPVRGFPSFGQCAAKQEEAERVNDTERQTMQEMGVSSLTYSCLPDTVDPRRPKGK